MSRIKIKPTRKRVKLTPEQLANAVHFNQPNSQSIHRGLDSRHYSDAATRVSTRP